MPTRLARRLSPPAASFILHCPLPFVHFVSLCQSASLRKFARPPTSHPSFCASRSSRRPAPIIPPFRSMRQKCKPCRPKKLHDSSAPKTPRFSAHLPPPAIHEKIGKNSRATPMRQTSGASRDKPSMHQLVPCSFLQCSIVVDGFCAARIMNRLTTCVAAPKPYGRFAALNVTHASPDNDKT